MNGFIPCIIIVKIKVKFSTIIKKKKKQKKETNQVNLFVPRIINKIK
jgi:hypothetical protein